MIQINLLPHREIKRRARQRMFMVGSAASVAAGLIVAVLGHVLFQTRYDNQQRRNQFLNAQMAVLDEKIAQIKQLREETEALLARKNVVETLQLSRTETVHLLDELVKQMPDGVYLKTMKQVGPKVTLEGFAQSNARVSTLMENLERSPWLAGAELLESRQVTVNNQRLHEFSLDVMIKHDVEQDKPTVAPEAGVVPAAGTLPAPVPGQKPPLPSSLPVNANHSAAMPPLPSSSPAMPPKTPPAHMPSSVVAPTLSTPPAAVVAPGASPAAHSPVNAVMPPKTILGMPTPASVGQSVSQTLSSSAKRSMP
jgi:type IV pilus assembly protein PilN